MADVAMARWLQSAGSQHLASPTSSPSMDPRHLPSSLMQDYARHAVQTFTDKQKLFRLMKSVSGEMEPGGKPFTPPKYMSGRWNGADGLSSPDLRGDITGGILELHSIDDSELLTENVVYEPFEASPFVTVMERGFESEADTLWSTNTPPRHKQRPRNKKISLRASSFEKEIPSRDRATGLARIKVVVQKGSLNKKEVARKKEDRVSFDGSGNSVTVHEPKLKVDLTAYGEKHDFVFDAVLDEQVSNDEVGNLLCIRSNSLVKVKQQVKDGLTVDCELQCFDEAITFSNLLQNCIDNRDFPEAKRLHLSLVMNGLDYDSSFGAPLIRMYNFFERATEAAQVFSKLLEPNIFSCTAMISAYGKCGQTEEVFKLYQLLQKVPTNLDGHTFVAVLQSCSLSFDLSKGRIVHSHVIESGWESDVYVGSTIIDMYSNCGCVSDGQAVFGRLPRGNLVTWSALMKGYSRIDCTGEVFQIFNQMLQQGLHPDEVTFIGILKACSSKVFKDAQHIHASIIDSGFEPHVWVSNALIDFYVRSKDLEAAHILFSKMQRPSPVGYSCLMAEYVRCDDGHQALQLYQQFQSNCMQPDLVVFVCTLQACTSAADLQYGQYVQADIIDSGYDGNLVIGSSVIDLYCKTGYLADAQRHFMRLPDRNLVTWNALITGFSQHKLYDEVLGFIDQLQGENLSPDSTTFGSILKVCTSFGTLKGSRQVHMELVERGLDLDNSISNTLIDMYSKKGLLADAQNIFARMPRRDVVAWTSLIGGYIEHNKFCEAFQLFDCMELEGSKPDPVAFACILKACCSFTDLDQGRKLHSEVVCSGWDEDTFLSNTLIDMYIKCGSLEDACKLFCKAEASSVVAWNLLIYGYIQHDNAEEALKLFRRMQVEGADVNLVTYTSCLKACSSVAAVELGRHIHRCLIETGCEMDVIAGSSLINMYAKCGSLSDAHTLFGRLVQRNSVTWTALLSGYAQHKKYRSAAECFQQMEREGFKPDDIAFLCLLSACSYYPDLVEKGCLHFKSMLHDYCLQPNVEHYNALIDMFGHANNLSQAEDLIETMPFRKNSAGWTSLQSACKDNGNVKIGKRCFDQLISMEPENTASYTLMAATYAEAGMFENARRVETLRKQTNGWKKSAKSFIEIDREVHGFVVGDQAHPRSLDIYSKLVTLDTQMKNEGYEPHANFVVNPKDWETTVCGHSERLAIALGLLSTTQGTTIRVSKNLRMCTFCHSSTKFISKLEMREIIVADTYCVHHFHDGQCSCDGD